ncbi:MAG: flagellar hook capping FlgD N-terminal domain-containing protein [Planctomycetota bacterium]|jgi:flagellar basal-body rod modification protein FlgD
MSQISAPASIDGALRQTTSGFSQMSSEDFIKVMFTELSNQDPFEPNDSSALLDQMNSIRSIESDLELVDNLQSLVLQNQLASGAGLIGQTVSGLSTFNENITGRVTTVRREGDNVMLELDNGSTIPFESMTKVIETPEPSEG